MTTYVALLRAINVGQARRVPMAELRMLFSSLNCTDVTTLLNSGNVIFRHSGRKPSELAAKIEAAIRQAFAFEVPVTVVPGTEWDGLLQANPLVHQIADPSRLLVAFAQDPSAFDTAKTLVDEPWSPDAIVIVDKCAYIWCESGVLKSPVMKAFNRLVGDRVTTRNWATMLKVKSRLNSIGS